MTLPLGRSWDGSREALQADHRLAMNALGWGGMSEKRSTNEISGLVHVEEEINSLAVLYMYVLGVH